nr:reverse transcriptase domain-containing protein [Tanacetum cinerariifolium]
IDPEFYSHKILLEDDFSPTVQSQRRVNPKIHDVIKKEVKKLLDAGLIYPISDSPWESPVHCVPKKENDREDIGKLGAKGDIGFFIGYSADSYSYRIFNRRTKKIIETMNVSFDELSTIAFEQRSLKLGLQSMTSGQISSGLDLTYAPSTITT